jgi:hypothetical protein
MNVTMSLVRHSTGLQRVISQPISHIPSHPSFLNGYWRNAEDDCIEELFAPRMTGESVTCFEGRDSVMTYLFNRKIAAKFDGEGSAHHSRAYYSSKFENKHVIAR